jgi:hypothetical protein
MAQIHHWIYNFTLDIPAGQRRTFTSGPSDLYRDGTVQVAAVPRFVDHNENSMSVPEIIRFDLLGKDLSFFYSEHFVRFDVVNRSFLDLRYFNILITVVTP